MADPHEEFIRVLRLGPRESPKVPRAPRLTCPRCKPESISFPDEAAYSEHLRVQHDAGSDLNSNDLERLKWIQAARKTTPARPESRCSLDVHSGLRSSSQRADAGSTPSRASPSTSDESHRRPRGSAKRPRDEGLPGRHSRTRSEAAMKSIRGRRSPGKSTRVLSPKDMDKRYQRDSEGGSTSPLRTGSGPQPPTPRTPPLTAEPHSPTHASGAASLPTGQPALESNQALHPVSLQSASGPRQPGQLRARFNPEWPDLSLQPESREISHEQLAAEIRSIYAGLTMVETKCVHVDKSLAAMSRDQGAISDEQWQAMIALHRTLLHEHHDFFLASQHPSSLPSLKRLALKYSMPARMWKHGIHSFLELLRHRLPHSLEYMVAFVYLAYQMMALLYETVDSFRTTWVECLGDLGRYRMAVEDEDLPTREIWAGVARSWYNKAADNNPAIGRLWHHLAILARPYMAKQLYLYNRSLTSIVPFLNARESIVTIFDPILAANPKIEISPVDLRFLRIHALLFTKQDPSLVKGLMHEYLDLLGPSIAQMGARWRVIGVHTIIAVVGAIYGFGDQANSLRHHSDNYRKRLQIEDPSCMPPGLPDDQSVQEQQPTPSDELGTSAVDLASELFVSTVGVALARQGDKDVLSLAHTALTFMVHIHSLRAHSEDGLLEKLVNTFPWHTLANYLNSLLRTEDNIDQRFTTSVLFDEESRQLPEDWMLRGLTWTFNYHPRNWFSNAGNMEEEERSMESLTSTMKARLDRVLSLAVRIAKMGSHLQFNESAMRFAVAGQDMEIDEGYHSIAGDDSPEMQEANRDEARVRSPFQGGASGKLGRKYSSIIADVDVLRDAKLFDAVRHLQLPVIVPEEAITELVLLQTERGVGSNEAAAALSNIRSAVYENPSHIRIETSDGRDVTTEHIDSPRAFMVDTSRLYPQQPPAQITQRTKERGENIEKIVRRETDISVTSRRTDTGFWSKPSRQSSCSDMTAMEADDDGDDDDDHDDGQGDAVLPDAAAVDVAAARAKPLLISDSKVLRAQAGSFGAAAIAGWMVKKWIVKARRPSVHTGSDAGPADGTAMDVDDSTLAGRTAGQ